MAIQLDTAPTDELLVELKIRLENLLQEKAGRADNKYPADRRVSQEILTLRYAIGMRYDGLKKQNERWLEAIVRHEAWMDELCSLDAKFAEEIDVAILSPLLVHKQPEEREGS